VRAAFASVAHARIASVLVAAAACASEAAFAQVVDEASAIAAAKRYTKAQCTAETPCTYKPRREGKQWNVWVQFTRRNAPGQKPQPYHGGHIILYFDAQGHLVRRVQGE
jgi:hypothetical protein